MGTKIRLARIGRKNLPSFRVVVANVRSKQTGKFLDTIGSYNPMETPALFNIDKDKLKMWQERGALLGDSVKALLDGSYKFVLYPSAKKVKREAKRAADKAGKEA